MPEPTDSSERGDHRNVDRADAGHGARASYRHPFRESGWMRLVASFRAAFAGLLHALATQPNLRIHVVVAAIVGLACWMVRVTVWEAGLLVICVGTAVAAEVFNTAIEEIVDLISPGYDERARIIKDLSAAAVLTTALMAIVVGLLVLGPKLWDWVTALLAGAG